MVMNGKIQQECTIQSYKDSLGLDDGRVSTIIEESETHGTERGESQPPAVVISEETDLPPSEIKKFFQAVEDGSIKRLEELFETKRNADPNMTQFTESLLMAAIRNEQNEVAEYLIDQLAINVQHTADMVEIRAGNEVPIRYRMYNCRELAYQRGMLDLVDLIDLFSDNVTPAVKRHLQGRLRARLDRIHQTYSERWKTRQKTRSLKPTKTISSTNINDNHLTRSFVLPSTERSYQSHIAKLLQTISTTRDKSIDESGKKTFRFSNYTLRFQTTDSIAEKNSKKQLSRSKSIVPSLPTLASSSLPTFNTSFVSPEPQRLSTSQYHTRLPIRDTRTSICRSVRRHATFSMLSTETQPTPPALNRSLFSQRLKRTDSNGHYFAFQQQQRRHVMYNPSPVKPMTAAPLSTAAIAIKDRYATRDEATL